MVGVKRGRGCEDILVDGLGGRDSLGRFSWVYI